MFMDEEMLAALMGGGFPGMAGFGGAGGAGGARRGQQGVPASYYTASITLEDVYTGVQRVISHDREVVCGKCKGRGAERGNRASLRCPTCSGSGYETHAMPLGMGMVQKVKVECSTCHGEGTRISEKDRCTLCQGQRTVTESISSTVRVPPGAPSKHEIVIERDGDQHPDLPGQAGDFIIVLEESPHALFERDEANLILKKTLTLAEAICGVTFAIPHLSGKTLKVSTKGFVINSGDVKVLNGYGLPVFNPAQQSPKHRNQPNPKRNNAPLSYGALIVRFEVTLPDSLPLSVVEQLRRVLPPPPNYEYDFDPQEAEECFVEKRPLSFLKEAIAKEQADAGSEESYMDMDGGGIPMQCGMQ